MAIAGELMAGLAAEAIITEAFKISFGRLRPDQSDSPLKFFKGGRSFFSGDVSTAFTFSTIMAKNYPRQNLGFIGIHHDVPLAPIFVYLAGGLVCLQRLYSNEHWSSDVYFGALDGYAVGSIVYHYGNKMHLKGFTILPGRPPLMTLCFGLKWYYKLPHNHISADLEDRLYCSRECGTSEGDSPLTYLVRGILNSAFGVIRYHQYPNIAIISHSC